jgi:hypothetical protein
MAITNSFRKAVASSDVTGLRIMMKDSLLVDPTFAEFEEMSRLAANVGGLFDPHDGREFESRQSAWDDNYMNKLMVQVVGNFSHERIRHLKDVVRYLRPVTGRPQATPPNDSGVQRKKPRKSYQEQKRQDERDNRIIHKKIVVGGIAGGVAAGAVVAVFGGGSSAIAAGAVAGALAVGLVMAKATSSEG